MSKLRSICIIGCTTAMFLPGPCTEKDMENVHPYRYSDVDMPVSLALGNVVRTPEFAVTKEAYFIMIQAEKGHIPFSEMNCLMTVEAGLGKTECTNEPALQAEWMVLDGDRLVGKGTSSLEAAGMWTQDHVFKFLGTFLAEANGKRYVVETKFVRDGTPLNIANPHLIVISVRNH